MNRLQLRPYESSDQRAVLGLFHSNVPRYFLPAEEAELQQYLAGGCPYFVAADGDLVVAAGGCAHNGDHAALTWGMVDRARHGQGIGRAFTEFRLAQCRILYPELPVQVQTSQLTATFYEKLGFRTLAIYPAYWSPDLDLVHLELPSRLT